MFSTKAPTSWLRSDAVAALVMSPSDLGRSAIAASKRWAFQPESLPHFGLLASVSPGRGRLRSSKNFSSPSRCRSCLAFSKISSAR